jgi:hypothetical protein
MEDSTGQNRLISAAAATSRLVFAGSVEKERGREGGRGRKEVVMLSSGRGVTPKGLA